MCMSLEALKKNNVKIIEFVDTNNDIFGRGSTNDSIRYRKEAEGPKFENCL